jgi:hypothetical protein
LYIVPSAVQSEEETVEHCKSTQVFPIQEQYPILEHTNSLEYSEHEHLSLKLKAVASTDARIVNVRMIIFILN